MARSRSRLVRRLISLASIVGVFAYRRQRLDAADRAFPEALRRTP